MRISNLVIGIVVVLASVTPTRADVFLGYRIGLGASGNMPDPNWIDNQLDPINNSMQPVAVGPPIPSNVLHLSEGFPDVFLQITLKTNANSPTTTSFPQSQWTNANRLISFAFVINYAPGLVFQPFVQPTPPNMNQNNVNATAIVPFSPGYPSSFPGYNIGTTAITGTVAGNGVGATAGMLPVPSERVIAVFRIRGLGNLSYMPASVITITDLDPSPTAAGFRLANGQNVDDFIFAPAHNNYPLYINAVPEPSSIALVGLAILGAGWRRLRHRKTLVN